MTNRREKSWLHLVPTPERVWIATRPVDSSSIAAAGYDERRQILRLRYIGGGAYDYSAVPPEVFLAFLDAPSHGRFVNARIKPFYACSPVR
jgi:hypothetical protein